MPAGPGGVLALLDTLTFPETITIVVIALVVLGPEKLPGMARTIGEWLTKAKRVAANLQAEMRDVVDDPAMKPLRDLGEFAAQPRRKLAEFALAAEAEMSEEQAEAIMAQADEVAESEGEAGAPEDDLIDSLSNDAEPQPDAPDKIVATGPDHPMERLSPLPDDSSPAVHPDESTSPLPPDTDS
jgi:sec-independent protein translocase protein TatB